MPWTDHFSHLSEDDLRFYSEIVTAEEQQELRAAFSFRRLGGPVTTNELVPMTLSASLSIPAPARQGEQPRLLSKEEQVAIILGSVRMSAASDLRLTLRVYLDPGWADLSGRLLEGGCEVMLMDWSSDAPYPAKLWRYLALGEPEGHRVTFLGFENIGYLSGYAWRTNFITGSALKFWRTPSMGLAGYLPVDPQRFGRQGSYPVLEMLCAFIHQAKLELEDAGSIWHERDLEGRFLTVALYPRAALDGILTLVDESDLNRWMLLDIEYVTWANREAELIYTEPEKEFSCLTILSDARENHRANALFENLLLFPLEEVEEGAEEDRETEILEFASTVPKG